MSDKKENNNIDDELCNAIDRFIPDSLKVIGGNAAKEDVDLIDRKAKALNSLVDLRRKGSNYRNFYNVQNQISSHFKKKAYTQLEIFDQTTDTKLLKDQDYIGLANYCTILHASLEEPENLYKASKEIPYSSTETTVLDTLDELVNLSFTDLLEGQRKDGKTKN